MRDARCAARHDMMSLEASCVRQKRETLTRIRNGVGQVVDSPAGTCDQLCCMLKCHGVVPRALLVLNRLRIS